MPNEQMKDKEWDRGEEAELDRFLNDLVGGGPMHDYELDPGIVDAVHAAWRLAAGPLPAPSRERFGPTMQTEIERLMAASRREIPDGPARHPHGRRQRRIRRFAGGRRHRS